MTARTHRSPRRRDALTRERIVAAAIDLLDERGADGLTFRELTRMLATGAGAIYHHVANKGELLDAATTGVLGAAPAVEHTDAAEGVRGVALGLFDAIDAHPWLGAQLAAQLSGNPWGPVTTRLFESFGRQVRALGVPERHWFTATSTLVHHVLGAAGQNAANAAGAPALGDGADRAAYLDEAARAWEDLDPDEFPVLRTIAAQMRDHDDREQFLAGVDLVLAGIAALR